MAVSSPASAAANSPQTRGTAGAGPQGSTTPTVKLLLAFVLTGLLALCIGMVWLAAQPALLATYHYNQSVIAVTHLFVLGWIGSTVMGAMYQLVPVALETKLYSEQLGRWQFVFHVVGFVGMVWMFRVWNLKQVGHFGSVLAVGVGLFVYNLVRTLRLAPKWNVTATAVASALTWFSLTILAGLLLATAKCTYESAADWSPANPVGGLLRGLRAAAGFMTRFDAISAMHAHAHLGAVGCFTMLLVGVSYKLVPMFTLSEVQSRRRAAWSVVLLNVGLAGSFVTILLRSPWKLAAALTVVAALTVFVWELAAIIRARQRLMLDWGIKSFLTALTLMAPVSSLAIVLSWPGLPLTVFTGQLENAYGFLGLIGVVTFAILGMLYKIIPFLVWFTTYSRQVGRARVPALADMYSPRLQAAGYWLYLAGLTVATAAILASSEAGVRSGCALLAVSIATLILNMGKVLSHLFKPRLMPLNIPLPTALKLA
jgi:cbb3-type cytochrome oxidase subunit 1